MAFDASKQTLWTAQKQIVSDTLVRDGVSFVKRAYIDAKYGEAAWSFREAYGFFREEAAKRLPPPAGAESAIWLYTSPQWTHWSEDTLLMEFQIPSKEVLLFDMRLWNRILNLDYLEKNEADGARFERELFQLGLKSTMDLFRTSFYPLQRREVRQSWQRLFDCTSPPEQYTQGAVWVLRREWLCSVSAHTASPDNNRLNNRE